MHLENCCNCAIWLRGQRSRHRQSGFPSRMSWSYSLRWTTRRDTSSLLMSDVCTFSLCCGHGLDAFGHCPMWRRVPVICTATSATAPQSLGPSSGVDLEVHLDRNFPHCHQPQLSNASLQILECNVETILHRNTRTPQSLILGQMIAQILPTITLRSSADCSDNQKSKVQRACSTNLLCETEALAPRANTTNVHQLDTRKSRFMSLKLAPLRQSSRAFARVDCIKLALYPPDHHYTPQVSLPTPKSLHTHDPRRRQAHQF